MEQQPGELDGDLLRGVQNRAELSDAELALLFGVEPAAIEAWRRRGVPEAHLEDWRRLREVVRRLDSHGRERSVAEELRTPLPSASGRTLLELLVAHDDGVIAAVETALEQRDLATDALRPAARERSPGAVVADVMSRQPAVIDSKATLQEAAVVMRDADVGDVFVIDAGRLAGVLTDRDIVLRGVAADRDPQVTSAGAIASRDAVTVTPEAALDDAVELMARHAVRRLPVVRDGVVVGAIGMADIAVEEAPQSLLAEIAGAQPDL